MKRRTLLKTGTAAAAAALAAPYVHAQSKKFAGVTLRINGYGGLYDEALTKAVAAPLEEKYGLKVQYIPGAAQADLVKLIANKENPPYDLFMGDSPYMVELIRAGVIEEVKASDVPNVKRILPGFREFGEYGIPFSVATMVPMFNSKHIKVPMTSYSDIARADLKDRAVMPAPTSFGTAVALVAIAEENGGSVTNMEPAWKVMAAAKPNLVALSQTNVAAVQMFQNEEVYAGLFWDGRGHELRTKGVPIVSVFPPKGAYGLTSYVNVVKGMKHREAAHAYCEQLLSDAGMLGLPNVLRYGVTTDVTLPAELSKDLLFNTPDRNALKKKIDWEKLVAARSSWIERFNKEIKV
jgi:spermidine/putrescine-binding protein